ncbi:MAG: STAS domain-containing protein [Desulfamplus sp.]|nr:STAS domain-containing protein [Desulfamplus sp.]MBF0257379.1 STAS domain-containing protein [Desulfamplus sp.]
MNVRAIVSDDGKTLTLEVRGKLDITLYKSFSDSYKDKIESVSKVVIDFNEVEYIDSSGLGMLLVLRERCGGDEGMIDIINTNPNVRKILQTTNFQQLFNIL